MDTSAGSLAGSSSISNCSSTVQYSSALILQVFSLLRERTFFVLSLCFWVPVATFMLLTGSEENHYDEHTWHLPAIRQIAEKWPSISILADSLSASPPGYHWALAGMAKLSGGNIISLRIVNALTSYGLVVLLYVWLRQRVARTHAALFIAPFAASSHFVKQASWIMTDNAGILLATSTLLLSLTPTPSRRNSVAAGILSAATLFTRQIHGWVLAALIAMTVSASKHGFWNPTQFLKTALKCIGVLAPSLLTLAVLFCSWHGLVPPLFKTTSGLSLCSQCYLITLFGLIGIIYIGSDIPDLFRNATRQIAVFTILGILLATILITVPTATSYNVDQGRWGGYLWPAIRRFPTVEDRSVFFFLTVPVGLFFVGAFYWSIARAGARREAQILTFAIVAWILSFVVFKQVFHRYFEPLIIVFMAVGASYRYRHRLPPRSMLMALGVFTAVQLILTFYLTLANFASKSGTLKL